MSQGLAVANLLCMWYSSLLSICCAMRQATICANWNRPNLLPIFRPYGMKVSWLDGKMGEYIVTARRAGNVWYVGGITDWTARDIEVDCSFLGDKTYDATLFKDGVNAHRVGRDYKCESFRIKNDSKLKIIWHPEAVLH